MLLPFSRGTRFAFPHTGRLIMRMAVWALGLVIAAGACASRGTATSDQTPTASTTRSRSDVITAQEIRESAAPTLADVVRQLRPGWSSSATVFVNNDYFGSRESLRNLSRTNTTEIRYLQRSEAQMKWGSRYYTEVIQVITGR
jgi:hypothetical protein